MTRLRRRLALASALTQIEKVVEGVPFKFYIASPLAEVWYCKESDSSIEMRFVRDLMLSPGSKVSSAVHTMVAQRFYWPIASV